MTNESSDDLGPADAAKVFLGVFGRTADRVHAEKGIPLDVLAKALVGAGLERWLKAEPAELIAAYLRTLADQVDGAVQVDSASLN